MNTITTNTRNKLYAETADPDILDLFDFYDPIHRDFKVKYIQYLTTNAQYEGATRAFEDKMKTLAGEFIEDIDIRIQVIYKRGTPSYSALLPDLRGPFQTGTYENKLSNLEGLAKAIGTDPALAGVKTDVLAFHSQAVGLRDAQQGKEGLAKAATNTLEVARVTCAQGLYAVLGGLMRKYFQSPSEIARYFDLSNIRRKGGGSIEENDIRNGNPAPATTENIFEGPFNPEGSITIINNGVVQLVFCVKSSATEACDAASGTVLEPGDSFTDSDFNLPEGSFFNVSNLEATEGSWQTVLS